MTRAQLIAYSWDWTVPSAWFFAGLALLFVLLILVLVALHIYGWHLRRQLVRLRTIWPRRAMCRSSDCGEVFTRWGEDSPYNCAQCDPRSYP